ncbi:MAG: nucleoside kinase [Sumerlaeia bacterium]
MPKKKPHSPDSIDPAEEPLNGHGTATADAEPTPPPEAKPAIAKKVERKAAGKFGVKAPKSEAVRITLPDGSKRSVPKNTPVKVLMDEIAAPYPVVAARFRNKVTSLDRPLDKSGLLAPVHLGTRDGALIYRRSLTFVLIRAVTELFPDMRVYINHSIDQGYYCELYCHEMAGEDPVQTDEKDIAQIEARMRAIIAADEPITRAEYPIKKATEIFRKAGMLDKVQLLKYSEDDNVSIYTCGQSINHFYGQLAPSTGVLNVFELKPLEPGFVLRFPSRTKPREMPPYKHQAKMFAVLEEYESWQQILEWRTVPDLNKLIENGEVREYMLIAEALHEKKLAEVADLIGDRDPKIVLLSGPSASGKTTSIKRLAIQLRVIGIRPVVINLDDFFVDRDETPRDEAGEYDFESLGAIDVNRLQAVVRDLLKGKTVTLPKFNFQKGRSFPGRQISLGSNEIILMEGIHALNDALLPTIPDGLKFKIYASPLTHLNIDDHNRISSGDSRLLRRLVRDFHYRGYAAVETLQRWPSVRRGEEVNIFPYQGNADYIFNSALPYEVALLKQFAIPVLRQVKRTHPEFSEAARLMKFLSYFRDVEADFVPRHSLLREFIGGSCFTY